jgi:hypothetical protein
MVDGGKGVGGQGDLCCGGRCGDVLGQAQRGVGGQGEDQEARDMAHPARRQEAGSARAGRRGKGARGIVRAIWHGRRVCFSRLEARKSGRGCPM